LTKLFPDQVDPSARNTSKLKILLENLSYLFCFFC
jgi:hypothetical protein